MTIKQVRKAVIPCGGYGTRMLPYTKSMPKEMLPVVDTPAIELLIQELVSSGITDILIITNKNKRAIEDHFDRSYELESHLESKGKTKELQMIKDLSGLANIHYVRQSDINGLGGAVLCAESFVGDEPFALVLGDDLVYSPGNPAISQLIHKYEETGDSIIGVQRVPKEDISKYGIVDVDNDSSILKGMIEKPSIGEAPTNLACLGRYVFTPEVFKALKSITRGKGNEYQLTDAIQLLIDSRLNTVRICEFSGTRYDLGSTYGYLKAVVEYTLRRDDSEEFRLWLQEMTGKYERTNNYAVSNYAIDLPTELIDKFNRGLLD